MKRANPDSFVRCARQALALAIVAAGVQACTSDTPTAPSSVGANRIGARGPTTQLALVQQVRALAAHRGIVPLPPAPLVRPALVRLGRELAFDKILSGNRNIACMTCHLPAFATGDGRSMPIGTGGIGFGPSRVQAAGVIIPRNSPPLFNLHALPALFWDGRVSVDASGHYHTPAGAQLTPEMTRALEFGAASAQGLFPVLSRAEMRGVSGNELAELPDSNDGAIWRALMRRLSRIPRYRQLFREAYPDKRFDQLNFAHATNAIAGFLESKLIFDQSPWDRFLAGDDKALTLDQLRGAENFLSLKCSICHNGSTFSDNQFHDVALAQFGPGEGVLPNVHDDFGRFNVTANPSDVYRFRTTPLRNVELTGPYGHAGEFKILRDFIAHYSESDVKLRTYDPRQIDPILFGTIVDNLDAVLAARDTLLVGVVIPDSTIDRLTTYMSALTDPRARDLKHLVPEHVPSGLPFDQ
jgi:cytochrome c peroxidase